MLGAAELPLNLWRCESYAVRDAPFRTTRDKLDGPTNQELFQRIWSLTWPIVVYNALEMTVGFVDFLMVRPFGPTAMAAMGLCRQVAMTLFFSR